MINVSRHMTKNYFHRDFNVSLEDAFMKSFWNLNGLKGLISGPKCFKNRNKTTCFDLILYRFWFVNSKRIQNQFLKSGSHLPKFLFVCFNDSPSKMSKNAFYFILKSLFVLKIFKFLSWLFGHVEKTAWLER